MSLIAKYLIVIEGEVDPACATAFEPVEVTAADGRTVLTTGPIDQSALHGLLAQIAGLGLTLVSVGPARTP